MYSCNSVKSIIIVLISSSTVILGANVLFFDTVWSPSHNIWNRILAVGLANNGHNVTLVTLDNKERKHVNGLHLLRVEGFYNDDAQSQADKAVSNLIHETNEFGFSWFYSFYGGSEYLCDKELNSEPYKTLKNYPDNFFQVAIFDITNTVCFYPFLDKFKVPAIGVTAFLLPPFLSDVMGNHWYPSYMPHYEVPASNRMSFMERIKSFVYKHFHSYMLFNVYYPKWQTLTENHFGKHKPLIDYHKNLSLLLANTDPIMDLPVALPPNIISVAGLHIEPPMELPKDIKSVMDNAKNGVIFFSLGTTVKTQMLPKSIKESILKSLGKLKETVIWKTEETNMVLPKNVIIKSWLPQRDILNHRNLKLFISHGGALSLQEALYVGVPVLGIPCFADQRTNVVRMAAKRVGLYIRLMDINETIFYQMLNELLTNPMYKIIAKKLSAKYRDSPETPLQRAVFWINHVIKHGVPEERRLPTLNMCSFTIYSLDVISMFLIIFVIFIWIIKLLLKCLVSTMHGKFKTNHKKLTTIKLKKY